MQRKKKPVVCLALCCDALQLYEVLDLLWTSCIHTPLLMNVSTCELTASNCKVLGPKSKCNQDQPINELEREVLGINTCGGVKQTFGGEGSCFQVKVSKCGDVTSSNNYVHCLM